MAEEKIVRWKVVDPRGIEIDFREDTYSTHIVGDHGEKDSEFRKLIEEFVKKTLSKPHLIMKDPKIDGRLQYLRLDLVGEKNTKRKFKTVKVVVDTDRTPFEIASFSAQYKLQGDFSEEDIVYEK